ncbi:MAG: electron transport complex subunit RsxE [Lachnospiraceae bacterium]|nr:electron transport complex subunit RsxE [Lachnospiraceae bacterium]
MNKSLERLYNGIVKENPTLVLMLGMCPTLAVTTSAFNGLGMGLTTLVVLTLSNMIISMLRKVIPNKIRIPAFIVIIASFVTIMQLILQAYMPDLYKALGIYIPLIVVNCIILGRAEAYAYKNPVLPSIFDGLGMGIGFTIALTLIGLLREFLGACSVFGYELGWFAPVGIFRMAPGAFFVLALLTAIQNKVKIAGEKRGRDMSHIQSGCAKDCMSCNMICKERKESFKDETEKDIKAAAVVTEEKKKEPDIIETPIESENIETGEEPESIETNEKTETIGAFENGEATETDNEVAEADISGIEDEKATEEPVANEAAEEPVANEETGEPPVKETPQKAGDEEVEFEDPDFESDGKIMISDDDDFLDMEGLEKMMEDDVDLDEKETKPSETEKSKKKNRKKKRKDKKDSSHNNTNPEGKEGEL